MSAATMVVRRRSILDKIVRQMPPTVYGQVLGILWLFQSGIEPVDLKLFRSIPACCGGQKTTSELASALVSKQPFAAQYINDRVAGQSRRSLLQ